MRARASVTHVSWAKAATGAGSVTLVLLGLEVGTRAVGLAFPGIPPPQETRALWIYDARKGWFHAPGRTGRSYNGGPDLGVVHINSLGLRGPEVALGKSPDDRRVLVFGDSFVFGVGVDEDHLFPARLEALLNRERDGGRYEVVNMGVSGYSTDQEYLLFEELGAKLRPDIVLLVVCDNDFGQNIESFAYYRYYKPYFELAGDGRLVLKNTPVPRLSLVETAKLWLGQHSNVWNFLRTRQLGDRPLAPFQVAPPGNSGFEPVQMTFALVKAFEMRAADLGATLIVMNTGERGADRSLFHALSTRMTRAGIRWIRIDRELAEARRSDAEGLWDFGRDAHWNVGAHRRVAEIVHRRLGEAWVSDLRSAPPSK